MDMGPEIVELTRSVSGGDGVSMRRGTDASRIRSEYGVYFVCDGYGEAFAIPRV